MKASNNKYFFHNPNNDSDKLYKHLAKLLVNNNYEKIQELVIKKEKQNKAAG